MTNSQNQIASASKRLRLKEQGKYDWSVDSYEIRDAGLSKSDVAAYTALHRNTVAKYWDSEEADIIIKSNFHRCSKVDLYKDYINKDYITNRLDKYPLLSSERIFNEIKKKPLRYFVWVC